MIWVLRLSPINSGSEQILENFRTVNLILKLRS